MGIFGLAVLLAVCVLACEGFLDCWFRGSIFGPVRAVLEAKVSDGVDDLPLEEDGDAGDNEDPDAESTIEIAEISSDGFLGLLSKWCPKILAELLLCRFCLRYHCAFWVAFALVTPYIVPSLGVWWSLMVLPLYSLAISKIGDIVDDWHSKHRD